MWSYRMELKETCFLTYVNIVVYHYSDHSVTLCGSDEHFTANDGINAYAKYCVRVALRFGNVGNHAETTIILD